MIGIKTRHLSFNKLTYPPVTFVVFLAAGDEDVVIIAFDYA
jgi:hypothetical protein